jgi:hypothetical protein
MNASTRIRAALAALAAAAASAVLAAPASAGVLTTSATNCPNLPLSQPFSRFLDLSSYELAPGGAFETTPAGWQLSGGAKVVSGNEPWQVNSAGDRSSLLLPAGASLTTPPICVGLGEPTFRFFAKRNSALLGLVAALDVTAIVRTNLGTVELPLLPSLNGSGWSPTLPMPVVANLLPLLPNDQTPIQLRVTAVGGSYQVDDLYVDPWRMR